MAGFLALAALSSCGGDVDKDLSENLVGHWRGPFIKAGYNADSTEIVLSPTDSTTMLKFSYPELCVRGKGGPGEQHEGDSIAKFIWEIKFGKLYLVFPEHPECDLEIWNYNYPVDSILEGKVDDIPFKLIKF